MLIPPGPRVSAVLKNISRVSDGIGGYVDTWVVADTVKGVLVVVSGNERLQYNKETVTGDYLFYARKVTYTPKEADELVYGTRRFRILFVNSPFMNTKFFILELVEVK